MHSKVIYLYKIKEGLHPNISLEDQKKIQFKDHGRKGIICEIPQYPLHNPWVGIRDHSFSKTAMDVWNSLPVQIRNIVSEPILSFKLKLNKLLSNVPDIPRCSSVGQYTNKHGRNSNSLVDILKDSNTRTHLKSLGYNWYQSPETMDVLDEEIHLH